MNSETREILDYSYLINRGILKNFSEFKSDKKDTIIYKFDCPEYKELVEKYKLVEIAGRGDNFKKAKRMLNHFAPRLMHNSMYDNHVPCNALDLLDYCYDKPENGINCLNKAKIFAECCLALGIPARRISIYPFSPYDVDNHVVTEIYDDTREKWVMMDMTTRDYFIDNEGTPLSMLEIREHFANNEFITNIDGVARSKNYEKMAKDNAFGNWYICKNSFYFAVDKYQGFGTADKEVLYFVPKSFSVKQNSIENNRYRIKEYGEQMPELKKLFEDNLEKAINMAEPKATDIEALKK